MSGERSPERWARLSAHFEQLIDLPVVEQDAALVALAIEDPKLASEVRALIDADARTQGLLEQREEVLAPVAADTRPELGPGWRVERLLGRGGMGEVWLAQRLQGDVVQTAAVKLLKRGMDSQALLQRFLQERRILARLNHPAIAGVLDAGITNDGRPFLAMDYICGEPLTAFARRTGMGLETRLQLLAQIARIVDYAHRQLVVHRDLKPSNVLVDDDGYPHLLDFGIAKVLGDDTDELVLTATGVRVLSPAYAAPEQVRGEEVGIAADVYGLGVLLYELVVGRLPHRRSGRMEMLAQEITGERATRPSLAAAEGESNEQLPPNCERVHWGRRLRGDLDTLILKAIHPECERRYGSAALLAEDIERYLGGRPIRARPDSRGYRLRKFLLRHRVGVIASAIALSGLLAGLGAAIWQAERAQLAAREAQLARQSAEREYARSEATKDFLVRNLDLGGLHRQGRQMTVDEWMGMLATRIDDELGGDPAAQGELRVVIGQSLVELGQGERGLAIAEQGRVQLASLYPQPSVLMASVMNNVGLARRKMGDLAGAQAAIEESMQIVDQLPGDHRLLRLQNRSVLDHILALRGHWAQSLANTRARLAERMDLLGADDPGLAVDYNNLAVALGRMDEYADALAAYDHCLRLLVAGGQGDGARAAGVERGRAYLLQRLGRAADADAAVARVVMLRERALPAEHADQRDTRLLQVVLLRLRGQAAAALAGVQPLLAALQPQDVQRSEYLYEQGRIEWQLHDWPSASTDLLQVADLLEAQAAGSHPLAAHARALAAHARWRAGGDAAAAESTLAQQAAALDTLGLATIDEAAQIAQLRADVALAIGDPKRAAQLQAQAHAIYQQLGLPTPPGP